MDTPTHRELCSAAVEWLLRPDSKGGPGCTVAFSEVQSPCGREVMDAFGVRSVGWDSCSVLVEVKTSRADFRADQDKPHRQDPALSGGTYRYYMAPAGLLHVDELPPRWGLVEYSRPRFRVTAGHLTVRPGPDLKLADVRLARMAQWAHEVNHARELGTVARLLARLGSVETPQNELKRVRGKHARQQAQFYRLQEDVRLARQKSETLSLLLDRAGIDFEQALADLNQRVRAKARTRQRATDRRPDLK